MKARELIDIIERHAPLAGQENWDAGGVQVAGTRDDATRLAVTLDPDPRSLNAALSWGADFCLSHHPLTLTPRLPAVRDAYHEALRLLLTSGAWLYAAHTSLDVVTSGPVSWLADELKLSGVAPLVPRPGEPQTGIGFVGDLPAPLAAPDFLARLKAATDRDFCTLCGPDPQTVRRVAVCPGSGSSLIATAQEAGADVFVTGDVTYHKAAEASVLTVDVGHFRLEEEMMRRLAERLARDLAPADVAVKFFPGQDPMRACRPMDAARG